MANYREISALNNYFRSLELKTKITFKKLSIGQKSKERNTINETIQWH